MTHRPKIERIHYEPTAGEHNTKADAATDKEKREGVVLRGGRGKAEVRTGWEEDLQGAVNRLLLNISQASGSQGYRGAWRSDGCMRVCMCASFLSPGYLIFSFISIIAAETWDRRLGKGRSVLGNTQNTLLDIKKKTDKRECVMGVCVYMYVCLCGYFTLLHSSLSSRLGNGRSRVENARNSLPVYIKKEMEECVMCVSVFFLPDIYIFHSAVYFVTGRLGRGCKFTEHIARYRK